MESQQPPRWERLAACQPVNDLNAFLLTSPSTVTWLSGYFYDFQIGPSPFHLLPAAILAGPREKMTLILADNESYHPAGRPCTPVLKLYQSYVYEKPLDFTGQFINTLLESLEELSLSRARIGIEEGTLPLAVSGAILKRYPGLSLVDISHQVAALKAVKDLDEIENIRKSVALCDAGQEAVLRSARPGMTELEVFNLIRSEMELHAGGRIPIMLDLVSGSRTGEGGGVPSVKPIREGDLVLSDLTPCLNGYWGDTCNTVAIGKPSAKQKEHFKMVSEALQNAIALVKPGIRAGELDKILRKSLSGVNEYRHHSGHGVGTNNHEEPRIVPYNETALEPNMVIALEPAIYTGGYGIRLEHLLHVTEEGCEVLSHFGHCFEKD